jgi:selenocysteine-specific elongation factor
MRHVLLGVIGHVDHGKTALVRALTGMETDRLPEEKRRGISIALGFAHLRSADAEIDLIDMPGHERFVRTMVAGATGIDAVLLVVDAREGVKPQTEEHVAIAGLLGIRAAVVAVSKCDLVSRAQAAAAGRAAAALLAAHGLAAEAPVLTSAAAYEGLQALAVSLARVATRTEARPDRGFAWLPIDRAFSVAGHGTIVTGTLRCGRLAVTDPVELLPSGAAQRVRAMQVHGRSVQAAGPGQRVAVNLRGVEAGSLRRGQALATPGLLRPASWIGVEIRLLAAAPALAQGATLTLLAGTLEVEARLRLLGRDRLEPGETALAQLQCRGPVALPSRELVILRATAPQATLGGGRVLDPLMRRLRRGDLARLARLAVATPEQAVAGEVQAAGAAGCRIAALGRVAGLSPGRVQAILRAGPFVLLAGELALTREALAGVAERAMAMLAAAPGGLSRERIGAGLRPRVSAEVVEAALAGLLKAGGLRRDGGVYRIRQQAGEAAAALDESALAQRLADLLRQAKLAPPDIKTLLASHPLARAALSRLLSDGVLVRTLDRVQKREILFHREAIQAAQAALSPHLAHSPGLLVGEAGALLGITRKYAVPLLEYFDATQFTRRVGDRRVLARATLP